MTTEERLENLERELGKTKAVLTASKRRSRWLLGGVACLIVGAITIAATPGNNKTIRANCFIVEDANGKTRAIMDVGKNGPELVMLDANSQIRAGMNVGEDGPKLAMLNANGKACAWMRVDNEGPGLIMFDANSKAGVQINVDEDMPSLVMTDGDGKTILSAPR